MCQGCHEGQGWLLGGHPRGQGGEVHQAQGIRSHLFQRPCKNMVTKSLQCATLHWEHMEHMRELEAWALKTENRSCQDFLLVHQAILHQSPQSLKEDLHSSYSLLLGPSSSSLQPIPFMQAPQTEGQPPSIILLKPEPEQSPPQKRWHSSADAQGDISMDEDFPVTLQEKLPNSKKGKTANWLTSMKSSHADAFSWDSNPVKEVRAYYFTMHSWDWAHSNMEDLSDIFIWTRPKSWPVGWVHFQNATVMGRTRTFETHQLCSSVSTQGAKIPEGSICQGISKGHGSKGNSWPQGPPLHILPVVWKSWTEWGDCHKSPKNSALQVRPHMQPVLQLPHNNVRCSLQTWMPNMCELRHCLQEGTQLAPHLESA